MVLISPDKIKEIDNYAESTLGFSKKYLMSKSAEAVLSVICDRVQKGSRILILAGSGNNGGDGYALATLLFEKYSVFVLFIAETIVFVVSQS